MRSVGNDKFDGRVESTIVCQNLAPMEQEQILMIAGGKQFGCYIGQCLESICKDAAQKLYCQSGIQEVKSSVPIPTFSNPANPLRSSCGDTRRCYGRHRRERYFAGN